MSNYIQCAKGHYYENNLRECPHCPSSSSGRTNSAFENTSINTNNQSDDFSKTQISNSGNGGDFDSTQFFGANEENNSGSNNSKNLNRTFINLGDDEVVDGNLVQGPYRASRKITGWLISYTIDPMGVDFRIFEGGNSIGRDVENNITITEDPGISSKHIYILSKNKKFHIKDEMTANGTFINDNEIDVGVATELFDNDVIRIGKTILKFRTSI